jgi:hypothetical protein
MAIAINMRMQRSRVKKDNLLEPQTPQSRLFYMEKTH